MSSHKMVYCESLSQLMSLSINKNNGLTADGIEAFTNLSNLVNLNLERCSRIHGGIIHLRGLHELSHLDLQGCPVIAASFGIISGLIETLNLDPCKISCEGLLNIKGLTSLRTLELSETGVKSEVAKKHGHGYGDMIRHDTDMVTW
ncbi:uncharacterized protein LOC120265443 isoform X2 [Dioscorea cayenensis subsp. rotundata]|uniref:Uncharacterized protein LOC120265443 isoform X2 n=1 Tax=Dioscorea cayennensis subsp. rotundata TaxID=55577 RepID=A0AB40BP93_DIOCR|nr:uncharacterized protein LOC120265443 isoform X2 [Dioscorea cayenensis subsp. rotundata]